MEKKMRGTKYAELPSSLHTVMSNDDLLIEILLCLPELWILVCKSVSKRWLSLITDTSFTLRCSQTIPILDSPSGLFLGKPEPFFNFAPRFEYSFVPFDVRTPRNMSLLYKTFTFGSEEGNVKILQSCNGLLLCCSSIEPYKLYVYNPTINKFKMIPRPLGNLDLNQVDMATSFKMAFDPTKSLHYKVLYVGRVHNVDDDASTRIQTYSSETGKWNVSGDHFSVRDFSSFCNAIYWNDAIHWLRCMQNPMHIRRLYIVDHPVLTNIQTPPGNMLEDCKLFESLGCLLFLCRVGHFSRQLNIYEMSNGDSRWSMKFLINLDDVKRLLPLKTWRMPNASWRCYDVWSIVWGKRKEESYMVMGCYGNVVQYRFELEKENVRTLSHYGSENRPYYGRPEYGFQFIASFARDLSHEGWDLPFQCKERVALSQCLKTGLFEPLDHSLSIERTVPFIEHMSSMQSSLSNISSSA